MKRFLKLIIKFFERIFNMGRKEMIYKSLDLLVPEMREKTVQILNLIRYHNLPFKLFETYRTAKRQQKLFKKGHSKCDGIKKLSKHQLGKAVDFVYWDETLKKFRWDKEIEYWYKILGLLVTHQVPDIIWGGNWKTFKDLPHFELKE